MTSRRRALNERCSLSLRFGLGVILVLGFLGGALRGLLASDGTSCPSFLREAVQGSRGAERLQLTIVPTAPKGSKRQRAWANSPLLCSDGSLSRCTCGAKSRRGCCSGHGGVARCSVGG